MENNILQQKVFIDHDSHRYYDLEGNSYMSTTKLLSMFSEKADFTKIAGLVADKRLRIFTEMARTQKTTIQSISLKQNKFERGYTKKTVLAEWDAKRIRASDAGSYIHANLEKAGITGLVVEDDYSAYYEWFLKEYAGYKKRYHEQIVYLDNPRVAGLIDFCHFRQGPKSMFNIRDFKTNDYNIDSTGTDQFTRETKHYNRYLLPPLHYLEDCDVTKYALQQSIYMVMAEHCLGVKPGNLAIIKMPWEKKVEVPYIHYLPYMKMEALAILSAFGEQYQEEIIFDANEVVSEDSEMMDFDEIKKF